MRRQRLTAGAPAGVTLIVSAVALVLFSSGSFGREPSYYPGTARFEAEHADLFFPAGVSKLVFDTTDCTGCKDTLPSWRFIGDIKVDSVTKDGTTEALENAGQMSGIEIASSELITLLRQDKVTSLERRIASA